MIKVLKNIIISEKKIFDFCIQSLEENERNIVSYLNQHCFNVYFEDSLYAKYINESKIKLYLDGVGVYYAFRLLYPRLNPQKFNASDFYDKLFQFFIRKKTKVFLIGGNFSEEVITNSQLNIVGYSNGFFEENKSLLILDKIRASEADVIILGMGVPTQEKFAITIKDSLNVPLILCVGNFLEFYFGTKKRAPKYIRNSGFEWAFRILTEPGRLFPRYFLGIPKFILRVIKLKLNENF